MFKKFKQYFNKLRNDAKDSGTSEKNILERINDLYNSLNDDTICITIGSDLVNLIDSIISSTDDFRSELKDKTGFILPPVRYTEDTGLQENEFSVYINGNNIFSEFVIPNKKNIFDETKSVLDKIYKNHLKDIFSNEVTEKYINAVKTDNYKLAVDVCYRLASVEIKYILVDLLEHNKSINNIVLIFEKISEQIYIDNTYMKYNLCSISKEIIKNI